MKKYHKKQKLISRDIKTLGIVLPDAYLNSSSVIGQIWDSIFRIQPKKIEIYNNQGDPLNFLTTSELSCFARVHQAVNNGRFEIHTKILNASTTRELSKKVDFIYEITVDELTNLNLTHLVHNIRINCVGGLEDKQKFIEYINGLMLMIKPEEFVADVYFVDESLIQEKPKEEQSQPYKIRNMELAKTCTYPVPYCKEHSYVVLNLNKQQFDPCIDIDDFINKHIIDEENFENEETEYVSSFEYALEYQNKNRVNKPCSYFCNKTIYKYEPILSHKLNVPS